MGKSRDKFLIKATETKKLADTSRIGRNRPIFHCANFIRHRADAIVADKKATELDFGRKERAFGQFGIKAGFAKKQ